GNLEATSCVARDNSATGSVLFKNPSCGFIICFLIKASRGINRPCEPDVEDSLLCFVSCAACCFAPGNPKRAQAARMKKNSTKRFIFTSRAPKIAGKSRSCLHRQLLADRHTCRFGQMAYW